MSEERITKVTIDLDKPLKSNTDWARVRAISDDEAHTAALADPDNPPLTPEDLARLKRVPNVKAIREALGLAQRDFAERYHLSLATVRDWEQGRYQPDQAARTLLLLIAREPDLVERALK